METRRLQSDLWVSQCAISGRYYNAAVASGAGGGSRIVPPPREGPVTKHLRVTAALILRNLAKHVPEARRSVSFTAAYSSTLASVFFFNISASGGGMFTNAKKDRSFALRTISFPWFLPFWVAGNECVSLVGKFFLLFIY